MNPALAFLAVDTAFRLLDLAMKARAAAQQSGEWTPEQEQQFSDKLNEITSQPHWKVE